MTRSGVRDIVTITVMIRFNLGDAHALIVPSMFRTLCREICLQLLLDRVLGIRFLAGAGCQPWPAIFLSTRLILSLSTPGGMKG